MIIIRIHNKHNVIYKHNSKALRYNATLIPSSCMCCSYMLRVCGCVFCLFLFRLYICVCVYLQIQGPLRECRSIRPGVSGLPYYCAPLVCVPEVIGLLALWRHIKPKTKTICVCSWCNWRASCVDSITKPKKNSQSKKLSTYKTTFMCPRSIAGVSSSQALPGFLITAPHLCGVPAVIGALAVCWQNKTKTKKISSLLVLCPSDLISYSSTKEFP